MFISPAVEVYEGMVVGQNALTEDIELNVCKTKNLPICALAEPTTR